VKREALFQALAEARHADPFGVLGPHVAPNGVVIRAIVPTAEHVTITHNGSPGIDMACRHPAGIFEATIAGAKDIPDYRLRVSYQGGGTAVIDDAYRYGRILTDYDLYLFAEGKHTRIYDKLGAHAITVGEASGVHFAVWAPTLSRERGRRLQRLGRPRHPMRSLGASGVWEIFVPSVRAGERYKFELLTHYGEVHAEVGSVRLRLRASAAERVDRRRPAL
jgi:1,4-alpha-glucan branching enzyme